MRDDLISRKAVLASIKNLYPDMPVVDIFNARQKWLEKYAPYFECENVVEHLPPVTPQLKIGHWIERRSRATGHIESVCSECGAEEGYPYNDYCGNCGAKMFEPQESEVEKNEET